MRKVQGSADTKLIECVNPTKGKWRIRWNMTATENGQAEYMEEEFDGKPTAEEIKSTVIDWYNEGVKEEILSGFTYEGNVVWLSEENQMNYKTSYDLAVQTNGANLPVTFKFGGETPIYRTFKIMDELKDFYNGAVLHIINAIEKGWKAKDSFRIEDYI